MIKISIIVPVYNSEQYIGECLDSLVSQTLSDIEIICVDDASKDESCAVLERYAQEYENFRIIKHNRNMGLSEARNSGLDDAQGKYIMFVDSDDYLKNKEACKILYVLAEKDNTDIIYYAYEKLEDDGRISVVLNSENTKLQRGVDLFCASTEEKRNRIESWSQFYNRCFLQKNGIRFQSNLIHEDDLFYFYTAMLAQRVVEINDVLYVYRQRNGSIMKSPLNETYVKSYFLICCRIFEYWKSHTFSERENKAIGDYLFRNIVRFQHAKKVVEYNDNCWKIEYPEEFIYRVLRGVYSSTMVGLSKEQLCLISKADKVVMYGAGSAAIDIVDILNQNHIRVDLVVISKKNDDKSEFRGITVCEIEDIVRIPDYQKAVFIIATTTKYHDEIEKKLRNMGFNNIVKPEELLWRNPSNRE